MADITIDVLEPAVGFPDGEERSFVTLKEAKLFLGLREDDTENDELLKMQIAINSAVIMRVCNRVFARQKVAESWRDLGSRRLFLTHWPVKREDIESVRSGARTVAPGGYELEEQSGKLSNFFGWVEPVVVTYTGGFALPDEAELALKQSSLILLRQARLDASREAVEGIRMIAHKEARVMFFDPSSSVTKATTVGTLGTGLQTVDQLLFHYMRFWV
jgi:hypothetical protein